MEVYRRPKIYRKEKESSSCVEKFLVGLSWFAVVVTFPLCLCFILVVISQYQRCIILRNGKLRERKAYGPGLTYFLPCVDELIFCDLRTVAYEVPPQEVLTKDSLTVSVDCVILYKISDPLAAVLNVTDQYEATQLLAATTLRNAIGTRQLSDLLAERAVVSQEVHDNMVRSTSNWGITVLVAEIKEINLPLNLQKAMAAEAESARLVNAKIIVAQAEIESTKSLETATAMLTENPYAMQLRYLQSLHAIVGDNTETYVIPIATKLFGKVLKGG